MLTKIQAFHIAQRSDDAWSHELNRLFGKRAGDVRYTKQGNGELGTELARLYRRWTEGRHLWEQAFLGYALPTYAAAQKTKSASPSFVSYETLPDGS